MRRIKMPDNDNDKLSHNPRMIVGICGSPRTQATEFVLKKALNMLKKRGFKTQFFTVRNKDIGFCIHCDYCLTSKQCVMKDDMYQLYPLLIEASGIIIASPVYNGGISAQTKTVIDRCRALAVADPNYFQHKAGMGIAVGGDRIGGQELAIQQIITFFIINGIVPISGGSFGANLGATFWSRDTLKGVKADTEGYRSLRKNIRRFTEYLDGINKPS
jgi:multimeric flavodoxin WrbA